MCLAVLKPVPEGLADVVTGWQVVYKFPRDPGYHTLSRLNPITQGVEEETEGGTLELQDGVDNKPNSGARYPAGFHVFLHREEAESFLAWQHQNRNDEVAVFTNDTGVLARVECREPLVAGDTNWYSMWGVSKPSFVTPCVVFRYRRVVEILDK